MLGIGLQIQAITRTLRIYLSSLLRSMITSLKSRGSLVENVSNTTEYLKFLEKNELLDKASIIITPTSVSPGFIHAAKPISTFGPELIVNGDFATDSNWSKHPNVNISGGSANWVNSIENTGVTQSITFNSGSIYIVKFTVLNYLRGGVKVRYPGIATLIKSNGNYSFKIVADQLLNQVYFQGLTDGDANINLSIDNVSVKEVIDADLNVTRNCPATKTNELGFIETVANNVARIDYTDPLNPSILAEPQRTNLFTYSEDFSNNSSEGWSKTRSSFELNNVVNPRGEIGSYYLKEDSSANNSHEFFKGNINFTAGKLLTCSIFVKRKEGVANRFIRIQFSGPEFNSGSRCVFDLQNNVFTAITSYGTGSETSAKMEYYKNDWYKISLTGKISDTTTVARCNFYLQDQSNIGASYTGDGVSGVYLFGGQLEESSYATSYIPTLATIVTRLQDVISKTGISSYINSAEGTLYFESSNFKNNNLISVISLTETTNNENRILIMFNTNGSIRVFIASSNAGQINNTFTTIYNLEDVKKIAVSYKQNDFKVFINGIQIFVTNVFTAPLNLSNLNFSDQAGNNIFYGKFKNLQVLDILTDEELVLLTGTQDSTYYDNYFSMSNNLNYTIE